MPDKKDKKKESSSHGRQSGPVRNGSRGRSAGDQHSGGGGKTGGGGKHPRDKDKKP